MPRRPRIVLVAVALAAGCSQGGLEPGGPEAERILDVTTILTIAAVAVCLLVMAVWWWAVRRPGSYEIDDTAQDRLAHATLERRFVIGGGVVLPGALLVALFVLGVWTTSQQPQQGEVVVEVVGHQYWWEVSYVQAPGVSGTFTTANELAVPVGTDVTVLLRSQDVIHSFWVPQLAGKVDMVPGRENELTFSASRPGTYEGICAEFCGIEHAWMKFEVVALEQAEFTSWYEEHTAPAAEPATETAARGREVFLGNSCVGCHSIRGVSEQGGLGPDLTHLASRDELGAGILALNRGNLTAWVADPQAIKPGNLMPAQDLPEDELQELVDYLLSLR